MDIYGVTGFIANGVFLITAILTTKSKKNMKALWINPYGKVFLGSLIYTLLVFIIPWRDYEIRRVPIKKETADSLKERNTFNIGLSESLDTSTAKPHAIVANPHPDTSVHNNQNTNVLKASKDTISEKPKFDVKNNTFNAPAQIGDNNLQLNGKIEHQPEDGDVSTIMRIFNNKDRKITIQYQTPDSESKRYSIKLQSILKSNGYKNVDVWDHLSIGFPSQQKPVILDTAKYVISVEWN